MVASIHSQNISTPIENRAAQSSAFSFGSLFSRIVASTTRTLATGAGALVLPNAGIYKNPIDTLQNELNRTTGSRVLSETCRYFSVFSRAFLEHHIHNGPSMDPNQRCRFVEAMFQDKNSANPEYGLTGQVVQTALSQRPEIVQEIVQINLLKMFLALVTKLKKIQNDNPFWLVDIVREAQNEIIRTLDTPDAPRIDQWPILCEKIVGALMAIALPNQARDVEVPPMVGQSSLQAWLYDSFKTAMLPRILNYSWNNATCDFCRDITTKKIVHIAESFFFTPIEKTKNAPQNAPKQYPHKEAFVKSFTACMQKCATAIDPKLGSSLSKFPGPKMLRGSAETLITTLSGTNITDLLNTSFEGILSALNDGSWAGTGEGKKFRDTPDTFFSYDRQEAADLERKARTQEELQTASLETIKNLGDHYDDLASRLAESIVHMPGQKEQERIIDSGTLLEKIDLTWRYFVQSILSVILGLILLFCGDSLVKDNMMALFRKAISTHMKDLFQPLVHVLANKITA